MRRLMASSSSGGHEKERETEVRPPCFLTDIYSLVALGMKKLKQKIGVSKLSFSVPPWMEPLLKQRAQSIDLTMSQYIRALVRNDLGQAKVGAKKVVNASSTECEP